MNASSGPTALVTGVSGQDGIYLARHLIQLGYRVVGTVLPGSSGAGAMAPYLEDIAIHELDVRDRAGFADALEALRPTEVYNLAALTSVGASWRNAELVAETNAISVLRMLEELVAYQSRHGQAPRFYQPSSSEMFGVTDQQPQTETTPHYPRSPYAAAKSFAHHLTVNYRDSYGLFTCNGTLYNHESPLRPEQFVTRKITRSVAEIALGKRSTLTLGNLDVRRDWGAAYDYVRSMHLMLQQDQPADLIVATGIARPLSELLDVAFAAAGLGDPAAYVEQDPALMRPADVPQLQGDATKAGELTGWAPSVGFDEVIAHMVRIDIERLSSGVEESLSYLYP